MPTSTPSFLTKASIESVLILTVIALVLVQGISFGISAIFPYVTVFKTGVLWLLLILGVSVILPYSLLRNKVKYGSYQAVTKTDVILVAIVYTLAYFALVNVKILIPQIFSIQAIDAFNQNALAIISTIGR